MPVEERLEQSMSTTRRRIGIGMAQAPNTSKLRAEIAGILCTYRHPSD